MSRLPLLSLTLPIVLAVAGCDRQSAQDAQPKETATATAPVASDDEEALNGVIDRSHAGESLPDATVEGPNGVKLQLAKLTGGPVLINLWATWCAPCVKEMPTLDKLAAEPGSPRILAISEDLKGAEAVNPFLQQHRFLHLQVWLDPQANLSLGYGGNLPTTVLYDKNGKEVWRMLGGFDWSSDEAKALVAEAAKT